MSDQSSASPISSTDLPIDPSRRRLLQSAVAARVVGSPPMMAEGVTSKATKIVAGSLDIKLKPHINNVVVIYLENRSFNNLFDNFLGVRQPLSDLLAAAFTQRGREGSVLRGLPKVWGGMVPRGQTLGGKNYLIAEDKISGLPNAPFALKDAEDFPLPESVITRNLWHLFYQNQMQINGGKND